MLGGCVRNPPSAKADFQQDFTRVSRQIDRGEYAQACESARQLWLRSPDSEWGWRFKLQYINTLLYVRRVKDAEAALRETLPSRFENLRPRYEYLKAYLEYSRGDRAALEHVRAAVAAAEARSDFTTQADGLLLLAGEANEADSEQMAEQALVLAAHNHLDFEEAAAQLNLGVLLLRRQRFADAIPYFQKSAALAQTLQAHYLEVASTANLGECYFSLGDLDRSLRTLQRAIPLLRPSDPPTLRANVNDELGSLYSLRQQNSEAVHYFRQAFLSTQADPTLSVYAPSAERLAEALIETGSQEEAEKYNELAARALKGAGKPDPQLLANYQLNRANIAMEWGSPKDAEALYKAILQSAKGLPPGDILWSAYAQLALIQERAGKAGEARRDFENALAAIEASRSQQKVADYQITFLSALIRFYQQYVDFLLRQNDSNAALAVADSSRASVLTQGLVLHRQADFTSRIEQQAGKAKSALLFYWLAPMNSYVWIITSKGAVCVRLARSESEIEQDARSYAHAIQDERRDVLATANSLGTRLYATLIGPVEKYLSPGAQVTVIPDGALHGLNFETLLAGGGVPHYWLQDVVLSVAPSLGILLTNDHSRAASRNALLIGDPNYQGTEYPELPASALEIKKVSALFPGDSVVLTGRDATSDAYKNVQPRLFRLVHFSAHVDASAQSPLDSAIILSTGDHLYARDVMKNTLNADLVTISGCRSVGAKALTGEGMVGFAWAAFQAGARNAITSLWAVDDNSTAELMDHFYTKVIAGESYSVALRDAKLQMLKTYPKPYYWAAFQLYSRNIGNVISPAGKR